MAVSRHPLCCTSTAARLADVPADAALIERLEESFRQITADRQGNALAERFYARLFALCPNLRGMFPADITAQQRKLLGSLQMVIAQLREPAGVLHHLEELGRAHLRYGVRPEHYPPVCAILVEAIAEQSGDHWNEDLKADWSNAIQLISEIMLEGAKSAPPGTSPETTRPGGPPAMHAHRATHPPPT